MTVVGQDRTIDSLRSLFCTSESTALKARQPMHLSQQPSNTWVVIRGSSNEDRDTIFFWLPFAELTSTEDKNGRIWSVFQELFYNCLLYRRKGKNRLRSVHLFVECWATLSVRKLLVSTARYFCRSDQWNNLGSLEDIF